MALSTDVNYYVNLSQFQIHLNEVNQSYYSQDSAINHSILRNRLRQHADGSLEVVAKTLPEVFGEQIIRPWLDTTYRLSSRTFFFLKGSFSYLDNVFSKVLSLPVAMATQVGPVETFAKCVEKNLDQVYAITTTAVKNGDSKLLEAAHKVYGPFFDECIRGQTFNRAEKMYHEFQQVHSAAIKKKDNALTKCNNEKQNRCRVYYRKEIKPDIYTVPASAQVNNHHISSREWVATQGSLSWYVYDVGWVYSSYYDDDCYNFDRSKDESTVTIHPKDL